MGSLFTIYNRRINRKKYFLGYMLLGILLVGFARISDFFPTSPSDPLAKMPIILFFFNLLFAIYCFFALAIARLHDCGKSGRFTFLILVPFINFLFFLILLFIPGEKRNNQYGPLQK